MTLMLFAGGLYLVLSRPHGLWLLIGLELMLNASAPLLVSTGTAEAIALIFLLLFFALLEAAAALFILYHYAKQKGSLNLHDLTAI
ncbi:MAG: NADH-quinone oxidoreductase subunit K [Bacteroidia bacterium]|nr:NADH-quinone oxidoreductase subunit K [Bacteroidia bacterium]MCX7652098.1 NADH-quinone oxidoreductase subunit K [Bacteroidia bacterium]